MDRILLIPNTRYLDRDTILRCPMVIMLASHYREDSTCRCDEPICEEEGCTNEKEAPEIYCTKHLEGY